MSAYVLLDGAGERIAILNEEEAHAVGRLLKRALWGDAERDTEITLQDGTVRLQIKGARL